MSVEKNNSQEQTTSFQFNNYLKAGVVSMLTLGAYAIARATNFLPHWRQSGLTPTEVSQKPESTHIQLLQNTEISVVQSNVDATSSKSALEEVSSVHPSLVEFKEIALELPKATSIETQKSETTHQRKLLSQQTVLNPIPNQVINVNEFYVYTIDVNEVFGPEMQAIAITGNFPGWMDTHYYPLLKNYLLPDTANAVTVVGTKAYVADGASGLYILDISNPVDPLFLGKYDTPDIAHNVKVSGNIAYVADGTSLQILNVSDPTKPRYLSEYDQASLVKDAVVDGDSVYLIGAGLLQHLNVSNPMSPILMGNGIIQSEGNQAIVDNGAVHVATTTGVYTYNKALAPLAPLTQLGQYLSGYNTVGSGFFINRLIVVGKTVYISDLNNIQIIDVTDPTNPILLGSYTTSGQINNIYVTDDAIAYIARSIIYPYSLIGGLQIVNLTNPAMPILLSNYTGSGDLFDIAVRAGIAYVTSIEGFTILNIQNLSMPIPLSSYIVNNNGGYSNIFVSGTIAYLFVPNSNFMGFLIFNVEDPNSPILLNGYQPLGFPSSMTVMGKTTYLITEFGFQIIDVTNPAIPTLLGSYPVFVTWMSPITVVNTIAYLVSQSPYGINLLSINVANPIKPTLLDNYTITLGSPIAMTVVDTTLYLKTQNGLEIINVASAGNLPSASYPTVNPVLGLGLLNNTLTLASGKSGIQQLSLSDPTHPALLSSIPTLSAAQSITQVGVAAYVSEGNGGFQIFNMANSNKPILIGAYDTPGSATRITVVDNVAYIADGTAGVQILNLAQARLQGIPSLFNVGDIYTFTVTGTDALGNWATDSFQITVARFPEIFKAVVPPNAFWANKPVSFVLPQDTFVDPNKDPLVYNATLTDQSPLPPWLVFSTNNLTFSGTTPNVASLTTFTIQVTAVNPLGGHVSTTFPLVIQPNVPPTLINLISSQSASVGVAFKFVIPQGTFVDSEGDTLTYRAQLSDGSPLPTWLNFYGNTFSGVPGRGDTGFYSTKILPIFLTAEDGKFSTSTTFNINVGGVSGGELFVKIAAPLLSVAGFALGLYRKRALCLNRVNKKKYQRLEGATAVVGEYFSYKLDTPAKDVAVVQAKLIKPASCCPRFFKNTQIPIPGGDHLPEWLIYDAGTNSLIAEKGPRNATLGSLVIQVTDKAGVIREEFTLKLTDSVNALDTQPVVMGDDVPLEVLPKGPGKV